MSCLDPIFAVSLMKNSDGKNVLKFLPADKIHDIVDKKFIYGEDNVFVLPCMKCKPCREAYAKDWAIRCTLESQCHKYNYFVTLTYDNFHVYHGCKSDLTSFLKKLSYHLTGKRDRPKFFACMERGETTGRLHFHCVLFLDHQIDTYNPVKIGDFYHFSSKILDYCWGKGFVDVAPFEHDCARYVAKYSTKQGNCFMSRNLAKSYYLEHRDEIVKDDFKVYGSFSNSEYVDIPKCFLRWFLEDNYDSAVSFKLSRSNLQKVIIRQLVHSNNFNDESVLLENNIFNTLKRIRFSKERSEL